MPILTDIAELSFSYYGRADGDKDRFWHESWLEQSHMPELVRIKIATLHAGSQPWPDLVVAPRIDVDANCLLDLLTRGCRGR